MTFIPNVLTNSDTNNTTTTPLGISGSFTGTYTNIVGYNMIILTINSDKDGQIELSFSDDGTNASSTFKDTYFANSIYNKNFQLLKKYYRIKYINGTIAQGTFSLASRLSTIANTNSISYDENTDKNSNNFTLDAFGKLRVTNPTTLIDIKFPGNNGTSEFKNNSELVCTKSTGSGSATYDGNAMCVMSVTTNGDSYISQSRKYCVYQPGKSQLFLGSGVIDAGSNASTVTSRIGYFDSNNGFFYEYSNNTLYVVNRNNTSDTAISQTNWNIDKMDGYGPSGLNINTTKCQLFVIDFEWLGVGRIRYGFYANGIINYCHQIKNINNLTTPYSRSANLPIRYEISSTGGSGSLKQICSTIISEGGYNPIGKTFSVSTNTTAVTLTTSAETPIIAIKGISTYNHENILPSNLSLLDTTTNTGILYRIRLFQAPSVDPGTFSWNNVDNNSVVRYAIAPTGVTFTNSIIIDQGYSIGKTEVAFSNLLDVFNNILQITSDINGNSDILMITATVTFGSNPDVFCAIGWQEIY